MLLIRNANIKTMAGPDLKNGCLLLENGKIAAVGQTVDAPEGVETLDAQGRLLTPGCVEAHCHIGLDNEGMRWEGMDYNEIVEPLTPQLRAIDSINPQDEAFGLALRGGVTTACTGPGSANVVGGTFAIVKLAGKRVDRMILRAPAAMKCAFGENPKGCYGHDKRQSPMTRMAVAALLRAAAAHAPLPRRQGGGQESGVRHEARGHAARGQRRDPAQVPRPPRG